MFQSKHIEWQAGFKKKKNENKTKKNPYNILPKTDTPTPQGKGHI